MGVAAKYAAGSITPGGVFHGAASAEDGFGLCTHEMAHCGR
jgi:hypothetical protein